MSAPNDLYIVLEVVRTASVNDIKKAFRKLARRYHPDINPGDSSAEERFKQISEAYEILSDPSKREFYDQNGFYSEGVLDPQEPVVAWGFSFKTFDFSASRAAMGESGRAAPRSPAGRRAPERGQDIEHPMLILFADSIMGLKTRISLPRWHSCDGCNGTGRASTQRSSACPACGGSGSAARVRGRLQFLTACERCTGTGRVAADCAKCEGEGQVQVTDILETEIPAGVSAGSRIRFPGEGHTGRYGGAAGDLHVITNVAPHPFFSRIGDNLHCTLPVTFSEAALGAKIEIPTVDGPAVVRVPPGTQNGQQLRLRGQGAPSLVQPGMRGDQFIEIRVSVPRIGDERSKEILREFAQLNPEDLRRDIWKV